MADTFAQMIEKERDRLAKQREELQARKQALQDQIDGIDRELEAVSAYEGAKAGKRVGATKSGRRSGIRDTVLAALEKKPMARKDLLVALRVKDDKAGERSVSNALTILTKMKKLKRSADRTYRVT